MSLSRITMATLLEACSYLIRIFCMQWKHYSLCGLYGRLSFPTIVSCVWHSVLHTMTQKLSVFVDNEQESRRAAAHDWKWRLNDGFHCRGWLLISHMASPFCQTPASTLLIFLRSSGANSVMYLITALIFARGRMGSSVWSNAEF